MRDRMIGQLGKLERYLGVALPASLVRELEEDTTLHRDIEDAVRDVPFFRRKKWHSMLEFGFYRVLVYVLCRALRPAVYLETGVLHGLTTCFALAAVARNGFGQVVSVDLPSHFETGPANDDGFTDTLPPGLGPGWLIHERYRPWWNLLLGRSRDVMPEFFRGTPTIDIFLHDSEHTYATMRDEFDLAWDRLSPSGVLLADNIDMNTSFFDFCNVHEKSPRVFASIGTEPASEKIRFGLAARNGSEGTRREGPRDETRTGDADGKATEMTGRVK